MRIEKKTRPIAWRHGRGRNDSEILSLIKSALCGVLAAVVFVGIPALAAGIYMAVGI